MPTLARRTLFRKYAAYFAGLVSALLVVSGAVGGYFAYRESVSALEEIQRTKAHFAAAQIANFVRSVQEAVYGTVGKFNTTGPIDADDLRIELVAMLRYHPEVSELRWIAADGRERFAISRFGLNVVDSGRDWSADLRFQSARKESSYVGPIYFHKETEPYVTIAAARDPAGSVLAAEVNLKYIWDVISQVQLASDGAAYVVDQRGQLISHPDIGLVLAKTDLSTLPHVRRVLDGAPHAGAVGEARDVNGLPVVSTAAPVEHLGWTVFAEQSLAQAFRPVYASIERSVVLVLLGVAGAIAASVVLARRMVRPIHEIETRARELGEGRLDRRIAISTGDELEGLANQFNRMAARVQETHAMQETRIAERTRDLAIANEAKTRFLAAATHDLRQPIHALALFVGQLRELELPAEGRTLLEKTERSVEALRELLEACLDLSKLDVGAVTAEPRPLALQELLSRVVAEFASSAEAKGLALTLVPTSLWVRSDPVLLHRIVLNVVSNALRYTVEGHILIGCRRRRDEVELVIADTGVGISAEHLPNVFQEFYRAPEHRGASPGLGLGLAIVKRLALLVDHRIDIESEPGKGTLVRILMPRARPQKQVAAPAAVLSDSLRGTRVLVVDDEAAARDAMSGLLARWGCEVVTAASGNEALERAREWRADVVLCDLTLAGTESGVEVVERLRGAWGAGVACAFVTGESAPDSLAAARATGHPVALKPTAPAKLRALLEHLLNSD